LAVDPNAVLTRSVASQRFQTIAPQYRKIAKRFCTVQQSQAARSLVREPLKSSDPITLEETLCIPVPEASDHLRRR